MASRTIYVMGMVKWAKVFQPDEYRGKKFWSVQFYPDEKSYELLKSVGFTNPPRKTKEDDDGVYFSIRRDVEKKWKLKPGEAKENDPPELIDAYGAPWVKDKLIGNGSKATLRLNIFEAQGTVTARLETLRVDSHVPYEAAGDSGMPPSPGAKTHVETDMDQGIPF